MLSDRLLDTREAAAFLHVSEASIRRWADSGLLPVSRVGKRRSRRFREQDLFRYTRRNDPSIAPGSSHPEAVIRLQEMTIAVGEHLPILYSEDDRRGRLELPF